MQVTYADLLWQQALPQRHINSHCLTTGQVTKNETSPPQNKTDQTGHHDGTTNMLVLTPKAN